MENKKNLYMDRAFTLIELLVVVAIIGILAAIGVVTYNGYTSYARSLAIKTNHNTIVKKLNLFINQCTINSKVKLMKNNSDSTIYEMDCYYDMNPSWLFGVYFKNDLNNSIKWKNPYDTTVMGTENYVAQQGSCYGASMEDYVGFTHISSLTIWGMSDKRVSVCTCINAPCSLDTNRIEYYVPF
jgi:prepilin-type N-terminal cleavage/methylation domain-containing protein